MENYVALDEALNFLNGGNVDMLSVYEADIRHCLAESKMFEDEFGIVYEGAMHKIKDKIDKFVAWVKSIITKLKNFIKKLILKFKTSKIDYWTKRIKKAVIIDGTGHDKFKAPDIQELYSLYDSFIDLTKKTNDIYDIITTLDKYEDKINDSQKEYDNLKNKYKEATKKEEIELEFDSCIKVAEKMEKRTSELTKTMEDSCKKFDEICRQAPTVAKVGKAVGTALGDKDVGEHVGDQSYAVLINLATKIVNISTNSVLSAASCCNVIQNAFLKMCRRMANNTNVKEEKK